MNKELFNSKYYSYNEEANELSRKIENVIEPIFKQYVTDGYNPIEIHKIINDTIDLLYSEIVLINAIMRKGKEN